MKSERLLTMRVSLFHSIKLKTWLGIFLVTFIPLAVLGFYSVNILTDITKDLLIKSNLQAFQQIKNEIDAYVNSYEDLVNFLCQDERLGDLGSPMAREALQQVDQAYEFVDRLLVASQSGEILLHSAKTDIEVARLTNLESDLVVGSGTIRFGEGVFCLKTPLRDEVNSPFLLATISLLKLRKRLEASAFGTTFRFYLVTREGRNVLEQKDFPQDMINDLMPKTFGAYDVVSGVENEGSARVAVVLPILHYGLRMVIVQHARDVYSAVNNIRSNIILVIILISLIAFGIGTIFSIRLTAPIIRIADKANEMSGGNLKVRVPTNRKDEIGFLASSFNHMIRQVRKKVFEVTALYKVSDIVNHAKSYQDALDKALAHIVTIFLAQRGSILLLSDTDDRLHLKSARVFGQIDETEKVPEPRERISLKIGEGIAGQVAQTGEPILCLDCANDSRFKEYEKPYVSDTPKTLLTVPLKVQGVVCGVINLADRADSTAFQSEDLDLLMTIANQMAMSIENAKLYELAITDGLTKLFIHRYFQIKLDDEVNRSRRYKTPVALILFDVDHFKRFNDTWGHQQGDIVLREIGRLLKESVRETDMACRYGGEEFAIIMPHITAEQAYIFAERFRRKIEEHPFPALGDQPIKVTISMGVAEYPRLASDKSDLVKKADQALYSCKNAGRNIVQIWSPNP